MCVHGGQGKGRPRPSRLNCNLGNLRETRSGPGRASVYVLARGKQDFTSAKFKTIVDEFPDLQIEDFADVIF